eukprot:gene2434-biopygen1960
MDTPHPIDFTRGYFRWSIYSLESGHEFSFSPSGIFGVCMREEHHAVKMLSAILHRLHKNIAGDAVDWEDVFNSEPRVNFLSHAADHQLLHVVWPMLRNEPHFATKTEPIPIYASVCDADWDQLSAEDQKRFTLLQGFCDLATATLGSLCLNYPLDLQAVERCIAEGARVQHRALASFHPIDMFIAHGNVPAVKACMQTTHPIDFMIDASGRSLCIAVCTVVIAEDVAGLILEAIVKRIAENRPGTRWTGSSGIGSATTSSRTLRSTTCCTLCGRL